MSLNVLETKFNKLASQIEKDYPIKKFIDDVNKLIKEVHDMKSPTFKFGKKYKGKTVVEVFEEDPKYISYLLAQDWVKDWDEIYEEIQRLKPYYRLPKYREFKKDEKKSNIEVPKS